VGQNKPKYIIQKSDKMKLDHSSLCGKCAILTHVQDCVNQTTLSVAHTLLFY